MHVGTVDVALLHKIMKEVFHLHPGVRTNLVIAEIQIGINMTQISADGSTAESLDP